MTKNISAAAGFRFPRASDFEAKVNSETIVAQKPAVANSEAIAVQSVAGPTKADKARIIFNECYKLDIIPQRKDIINRCVAEAGLTKAGAATYLQNFKSKNGLTNQKSTAPAA